MWVLPSFTDLRSGRVHSNPAALLAGATNLGLERMARASSGVSHGQFREGLVIDSAGSSPRVRGTGRQYPYWPSSLAFIPARAGNGDAPKESYRDKPVHPRACGERKLANAATSEQRGSSRACGERDCLPKKKLKEVGSSPRVRGTADRLSHWVRFGRFIPARAGNG